jgi:hypothetical protein
MSAVNKRPDVSTWIGSPAEVRDQLHHHSAKRLLVISFDHVNENDQSVMADAFVSMATMLRAADALRNKDFMEKLAELLVPRSPPSPLLVREGAMQARARTAVLQGGDFVTAVDIAKIAGLSTLNPSAQPNKWKKLGQIFAVHHNGVDYFPGYGLDAETGFRPLKALATVIEVFDGIKDAWGLAYWFASDNSFLGGKRPQDVLKADPARVIAAARDEVEELAHG